jgi:hypothetical protein
MGRIFYTLLFVFTSYGCRSSTALPSIHYSNLQNWQSVSFEKLGVGLQAPRERYNEEVVTASALKWSGCMIASFTLHESRTDFLMERTYGVYIHLEVFSKEEWHNYLRGDRSLLYQGRFGEYEHKFCPRYLNHRKDVMASDGRVVVASASGGAWTLGRGADGEAQDEAAIRRIIESVYFIHP